MSAIQDTRAVAPAKLGRATAALTLATRSTIDDLARTRPYRSCIDRCGLVPVDTVAELALAGAAIASVRAAQLAQERLSRADWHDRRLADVVAAAADPALDVLDGPEVLAQALAAGTAGPAEWEGIATRVDLIAARTDAAPAWLRGLLDRRLWLDDSSGGGALRVRCAAIERRRIRVLLDQLDQLGVDVRPLARADAHDDLVGALLADAARALGALIRGDRRAAGRLADALLGLAAEHDLDAGPIEQALTAGPQEVAA